MDYPGYKFIRSKSKWLAFVWIIGDIMYYIGLFGTMFIVIGAPLSYVMARAQANINRTPIGPNLFNFAGLTALVLCIILFLLAPRINAYVVAKARAEHLGD